MDVTGAVVYEVDLVVESAIAADYRAWLTAHVGELLALPGFMGARVFEVLEPVPAPGETRLCVQYQLRDEASLAGYLRDHAPRLRAAGVARFGERFRACRRILHLLETR